jgi:hypothetical protein
MPQSFGSQTKAAPSALSDMQKLTSQSPDGRGAGFSETSAGKSKAEHQMERTLHESNKANGNAHGCAE